MSKECIINVLRRRGAFEEITGNSIAELQRYGVSLELAEKYDFIRLRSMKSTCNVQFRGGYTPDNITKYLDSENSVSLKTLVSQLSGERKSLLDSVYSGLLGVLEDLKQYSSLEKHSDIPFKVGDFRYFLLECLYYRPSYLSNLDNMVAEELAKISKVGLDNYIGTVKGVHFWKSELDVRSFASFIAILNSISEKDSTLVKLVIVSVLLFSYGSSFYDFSTNFNELACLYFIISGVFRFDYTNGFTPLGAIKDLYTNYLDDYILVASIV